MSICSDGSVLPNVVQTGSGVEGVPTGNVDQGRGLRRKIRSRSAWTGTPSGQTLSSVMNRSAHSESRPRARKSTKYGERLEMWLTIRSSTRSCDCPSLRTSSQVPNRGSISS